MRVPDAVAEQRAPGGDRHQRRRERGAGLAERPPQRQPEHPHRRGGHELEEYIASLRRAREELRKRRHPVEQRARVAGATAGNRRAQQRKPHAVGDVHPDRVVVRLVAGETRRTDQ